MDLSQKISQVVSVIPFLVIILLLMVGGSLGSWFTVKEDYFYDATDEDTEILPKFSNYDFYLNEIVVTNITGENEVIYSSEGYEERSSVFYNLSLIFYTIFFISIVTSGLIFVRDYDLFPKVAKNDLLAVSFGGHIAVIVFVIFLGLYAVMGIPNAMHEDHSLGPKECLYTNDITIVGKVEGCSGRIQGEQVALHSVWMPNAGFIIFVVGVLLPSLYLLSDAYQRFEEEMERMEIIPELYFDPEDRLLFDINTGEIVGSYIGDERNFFFDKEAMILFDENTGDIVYGSPPDNEVSEVEPEAEPEAEPEVEPVEAEVVVAESEPVEGEVVVVEVVESEVIEADEKNEKEV